LKQFPLRHLVIHSLKIVLMVGIVLSIAAAASQPVLSTLQAVSSDPYLVKDINSTGSSYPRNMLVMNSALYFVTDFGGTETIWKSDGTEMGTVPIKAVTNATAGNYLIENLVVSGDSLYFSADQASRTFDLWKTDGTPEGTILVKALGPGETHYSPLYNLTDVNGTLFFAGREDLYNYRLWKSDGTENGTLMVKGAPLGVDVTNNSFIQSGSLVYFGASSTGSTPIYKLWESDGTTIGTKVVKDVPDGVFPNPEHWVTNMNPGDWLDVDGILYFRGADGVDYHLWRTDGTADGTYTVSAQPLYPEYLTRVGSAIYFASGSALWKSDGTEAGTELVKSDCDPVYITNLNGTLFFSGSYGGGPELWKSDGTAEGTVLVKNIHSYGGSSPSSLTNVNGVLYFSANDGFHGNELWKSDGTDPGTVMVTDLNLTGSSSPGSLTVIDHLLYFTATDGITGREVWALDVTVQEGHKVFLTLVLR